MEICSSQENSKCISPLTIDHFGKGRILVLGDVMLDQYVWGKVSRISPEAPVPVVRVHERSKGAGGAGNVAVNLAGLGCPVTLVGIVCDDQAGDWLQQILGAVGVDHRFIVDSSRPTITKTRIMAQNQQLLRIDEEDASHPSYDIIQNILALLDSTVSEHHAIILSDYGKGVLLESAVTQRAIELGRKYGIPVLVDPKGKDWSRYRGATCVTPNVGELKAIAEPFDGHDDVGIIDSATHLREAYGLEWLLVTRGSHGMCLVGQDCPPLLETAKAREVFDVSGAGDTVIAALAAGLVAGLPIGEAVHVANVAAGIVVGKLGTQPVTRSELNSALQMDKHDNGVFSSGKVATIETAKVHVTSWRNSGLRVVFTNGCFDLLHPGHIHFLCQARVYGDRLVVGLNSDSSVQRLKGIGRPILLENDRAALLASLSCVDLVVLFEEDTPISLIEALRPDILVKGNDYQIEQVVGREAVEAYGGRVELVPVLEGYSTTAIANKIINQTEQESLQ